MLKTLRIRFVVITMTIVSVILCALLFLIAGFMQQNTERESLDRMRMLSRNMDRDREHPPGRREMRTPYFALKLSPEGDKTEVSGDESFYELSDESFLSDVQQAALSSGKEHGLIREYDLRFLKLSAPEGRTLLIFTDTTGEQGFLRNLCLILTGIGAFSFFVFLVITILLSKWAVEPARLAFEDQKRFTADASHELKTPLTVILTNAELLLSEDADREQKTRFAENILLMAKQMQKLVQDLLSLTRTDHALKEAKLTPLNLSGLCEDALLPFEPLYFEQGLTLTSDIAEGIMVKGSSEHLIRLLEILLENALKYSEQGEVKLELSGHRKHSCLLTLSNPCEEFTEEELQNIFRRFYRKDAARSRRTGYGLGLSIAAEVASGHGGRLWAEWSEGRIRFLTELPLSS